jgi:uncharacterized surface protein with fasciclin (FAS1) repeats
MQNVAIIVVIVVLILGGILFLGGDDQGTMTIEPATETMEATQADPTNEDTTMDETMDNSMETETPTEQPDIVETAIATPELSTLVTAVSEAELVTTLQGEGPFTVFAPTNDAFAALPAGTLDTLLLPDNQADLQGILTYHVVPGEILASDLTDGMTVQAVSGEVLTFSVDETGVSINGSATVALADIMTDNGVVHVIDSVLLPPTE